MAVLALLFLLLLTPLISVAAAPPLRSAGVPAGAFSSPYETTVRPILARYCFRCHNPRRASAGLNLEAATTPPHTWEKVAQRLRAGEMPPKGAPRPRPADVQAVTGWIDGERSKGAAGPGRVTARRLNRAEYNNTVRDLLGVAVRPADDFPQDDSGYGFDNIGDVLSLSPVLMEKYLAAAEKVARTAVFGPEATKPTLVQIRPANRRAVVPSPSVSPDYDVTGLTLPNALNVTHRIPVDGEYSVRVFLSGARPGGSEPFTVALWVDGERVASVDVDPDQTASFFTDRQDLSGQTRELRAKITAGEHWIAASIPKMYEGLPAGYAAPNSSKRPLPQLADLERFLQPPANATPMELEEFKQRQEARKARLLQRIRETVGANEARLNYLEIGGPYEQAQGPSAESRRRIYACGHLTGGHLPGCDRKIVAALARRAFRRPVSTQEVNQYVRLVSMARRQGDSFEEGICVALQAMLVSPHFLFRIERSPDLTAKTPRAPRETQTQTSGSQRLAPNAQGPTPRAQHPTPNAQHPTPITDHELATRLSYFLWSSMPDDELGRLADQGVLGRSGAMAGQVRRMLRDPRARALVENFGGQWLELRKLESAKPDRQRFPEFDDYLRLSMRRETELFLEHVVREDRSILDLIDGRYTFLNERLARFYGVPGVRGPEFRRVDLTGTQRGGVLTHASILTVSSYATRTSPVLRGRWILENILNAAPPPPPPGVPNLDETKVGESASLRQQLEAHRVDPTCASCHARMDPLGFALENYDAVGGWRTHDGKVPIDPSGSLPDGRSFKGPDDLRTILKGNRDAFARCIAEKLLTYALGRGLERYDRPAVQRIVERMRTNECRFSSLVLGIVDSPPFRLRRGEQAR